MQALGIFKLTSKKTKKGVSRILEGEVSGSSKRLVPKNFRTDKQKTNFMGNTISNSKTIRILIKTDTSAKALKL